MSSEFTCEDIEFTFRVHEYFRTKKLPYRILSLPDIVGVTDGPNSVARLIRQRARWQSVISDTVWHYRHMFGKQRFGTVGCFGVPYYIVGEILAPVFQALSVLVIVLGAALGLLSVREVIQAMLILGCGSALLTNLALLLQERHSRTFSGSDLIYMLLLTPLELFFYRPVMFWAQFKGMIEFMRGERGWNKFARNERPAV